LSTGNHNTLIGSGAGYSHTDQEYNVMIGTAAGSNINAGGWNGSFNTFMGINAGYKIRNSKENVFLGTNAGYFLENGWSNTIVGIDAGRGGADNPYNYLGYWTERNTFLGCQAGRNLLNGNNNVFIGYQAGYGETGVSDKLYISNSSSNTIIYGDFLTGNIGLGTTTLTKKLNVTGEVGVSGNISAGSITAPVTGNLTGNVTGNVTGDVNGLTMGKVFLTGTGTLNIVTIAGGTFALNWEVSGNWIEIINTNPTLQCNYWYLRQDGLTTTTGNSLLVNPLANKKIITPINTANTGFEIHFGQADGTAGWCSVWLQYYNGALVGHYIKY
jgi:hypothetical protein